MKKALIYAINILLFFMVFTDSVCCQQNIDFKKLFFQSYYIGFKKAPPLREHWMELSISKNVMDLQSLSYGLDAVLAMFEASDSLTYLDDAITFSKNVMNNAEITKYIPGNISSFKDGFKGWTINSSGSDTSLYNRETVLSEVYFFQYVCRLLKDIHNMHQIYRIRRYKEFYTTTLNFIEINIWDKWVNRGIRLDDDKYLFLLLQRTHMASHWAYIAADLSLLTKSNTQRDGYIAFVNLYNSKLEKNFHKFGDYITWNQTWDNDNHSIGIIQDVSHGNLVISYIVEAFDVGLWKDSDAVRRIISTVKNILWNPSKCLFRDNIDGTMFDPGHKDVGSFQADGFVKLTRYDSDLLEIYDKFIDCSKFLTTWNQHGQLFANLALTEKIRNS